ncbi:hypothetical protein ILYODFUR_011699 [Ilyodon furcidens]|uniref:Uncharacterized protein n=1 Tax=Ilyodon furcidens TaxID=33524 RepID=A0ABV0V2C3_9TELE
MMVVRETVIDYRHIWAVISRSHRAAAFSRRENSCIIVSHGRPGSLACVMPCQLVRLVITGFTVLSKIKQSSKMLVQFPLIGFRNTEHTNSAGNNKTCLRLFAETQTFD